MRYVSEVPGKVDDYRFHYEVLHGDPSQAPSGCGSSIIHASGLFYETSPRTVEINPSSFSEVDVYEVADVHTPRASIVGQQGMIKTDTSLKVMHHILEKDITCSNGSCKRLPEDDSWIVYFLQTLRHSDSFEALPPPCPKMRIVLKVVNHETAMKKPTMKPRSDRRKKPPPDEPGIVLVKNTKEYKSRKRRQSKRKKKSHKKHDVARHKKSDKRIDKKDSKLRARSKKSKKRGKSSKRNKTPRRKASDKHRGKSKKSMKSAKHKKHGPESSKKSKKSAKKHKRVKSSSKPKHKDKRIKGSKGKKEGEDRKRKRSKVKKQEERERAEKRMRDEQKNWIAEEFLQSPDAAAKPKEEEKKKEEKPSQFMDTQQGTLESQKKKIQGLEDDNVPPTLPGSSKRKEPDQPQMALPPMPSERLPPSAPPAAPATAPAQLKEQDVAAAAASPDAQARPSPPPKPRAQELLPSEEPTPAKGISQGISASDKKAKPPPPPVPAEARPSPAVETKAAPTEPFMKTAQEVSPIQTAQAAPLPQESPPPPPPPQPRPKGERPPYFAAPVIAPRPQEERKERPAGRRAPRPDDKIYGLGPEALPTPPQTKAAQYFVPEQQRAPEAPYGAVPPSMVPPPREREVPAQQEIRTAREFKPSPRERSTSDDRLRVNIDEILRLGAIMERRYLSPKKKMSFEWIALNRHLLDQQPEAFSTHLITAVGDVRMEKSLACDALNVLMYKHTITPDEYLRLCQYLENVNPITVGSLAQLLRSSTQYYSNLPSFRFSQRQPTQS